MVVRAGPLVDDVFHVEVLGEVGAGETPGTVVSQGHGGETTCEEKVLEFVDNDSR
jgi:hypothetical protein